MRTSSSASRTRKLTDAERAEVVRRIYTKDPVLFARDILGFTAWSKQREILESVRDNQRTSVRACHGPGKTATGAQAVLWFLAAHRDSRVITTAPTWAQIETLLWREIRAAVARSHAGGRGDMFPIPNVTKLELGDEWFAIGLSTNQPERFQGHHADNLLLVVDEASGVEEAIFEAAEGFMTAQGAKVLLLGNPTQLGGQFHRSFTTEAARWSQIHISVYDTPNFTGENVPAAVARSLPTRAWLDDLIETYGRDSPIFQVRALGEFSTTSEETVVALGLVTNAQERTISVDSQHDHVVIGCDVARFGSDETVITERVGQRIRIAEHYVGRPTTHTAGRIQEWARRHPRAHVQIAVDDTGVGGGVTDQLRAAGWPVTAFNAGEKAFNPLKYRNRRSELWFALAAQLPDLDLDDDPQLLADLTAPKYGYDDAMRRVVERKADTKKRLGRSPDRADAVMLTLVPGPLQPSQPRPRVPSITSDLMNDNSF